MPNELYVQWLKDWMDKAYDLQSKGYQTLRKAHDSMKACPIDIGHPSQAAQLKYIGPVLCARLEKTLLAHCKENGLEMPSRPSEKRSGEDRDHDTVLPAAKKRAAKAYVPAFRGGPYALLMGLTEPSARDSMAKSDLIRLSQPFCDASFEVASDQRGFYTAWNSIKTLIEKELVHKSGSPPKYSITDAGAAIAARIRQTTQQTPVGAEATAQRSIVTDVDGPEVVQPDTQARDDQNSGEFVEEMATATASRSDLDFINNAEAPIEPEIIPAGTFKIQLIIDNREVKTQKDRAFIDDQLYRAGIELSSRALDVGDALWIAKCHNGREIVLDHIVERKRMDDLVSSIKDGRFHEQKFRLQRCGARNIIYVIEETNLQDVISYHEAIQTALSSTQMVNGFFVKRVQSLDYTMRYLIRLTHKLTTFYEAQDLHVLPDRAVDTRTFTALLKRLEVKTPDRKYYLSFEAFSGLTVKSVNLQVSLVLTATLIH
ncbi:protein of unknown function [Taphrina deformans PYCC 5710]|uniref:Crossover junction endonuclease MUS81 n=1 Tax=Taphrina deformans (strain PYCC 5710 / ATCC 11124 / CBS 356.35 / IMI 108563 / JCM 9778 / NBRC 8474) TaxID=1097556 RepID=R4XLR3_TAPDE|nr:protein of unknown function [Taphrina deformans PYCC 5710]|eukprot:CCG84235.1 protein of unknown function [Taphrina deformans PYCC 5710]